MKIPSVLNELSLQSAADRYEAMDKWDALAQLLRQATEFDVDDALHTPENISELELAEGFRWVDYLKKTASLQTRELRRYLLRRLQYAPYTENRLRDCTEDECFYHGQSAKGLLLAYLMEGLTVSLNYGKWDTPTLYAKYEHLQDNLDVEKNDIRLPHASNRNHLVQNDIFFQELRKREFHELKPYSFDQLVTLFPNLLFCTSVEQDMKVLSKDGFRQVCNHLHNLNTYCENWKDGKFSPEAIPGKITPESISRREKLKEVLTIACPDGLTRLFDLHARYTPGAGRLYFHPLAEDRKIIVGIIRAKIE